MSTIPILQTSPALHEALGLVLRKTGDLPEAVRELRKAVELDSEQADYHRPS
jgi:Flp pilus assembly protein TadD